jgi:alkanesulfonate monooxygenase SsuD/methylene tetrahydromethanopterin reductase-like flavin-dependent oxidoreductase (luciferase family)
MTEDVPTGLDDAVEAERLGFRRVFLSERYNLKEAGVLLGGVGARTTRLGLATGVVALRTRHPLMMVAMGATLHAAFGPRFVLGIGRSTRSGPRVIAMTLSPMPNCSTT